MAEAMRKRTVASMVGDREASPPPAGDRTMRAATKDAPQTTITKSRRA